MNITTDRIAAARVGQSREVSPERLLWERRRRAMEASNLNFTPFGTKERRGMVVFERALRCFEVLLKMTGVYRIGHQNAHEVGLREFDLEFPNLPTAFDGYSILHLSDLHIDCSPGMEQAIFDASSAHAPDLCVMTGDFRAADVGPSKHLLAPMRRLINGIAARDGVVAVLGNHDDHQMGMTFEEHLGMRLLVNERQYIYRGDSRIALTGTDDVNRFYTHDAETALTDPLDGFGIALVHSPEMAHEAERGGHSLYLCGHTHGGQVALPGGRPIVTHLNRNRNLASGLWEAGNMQGYTSPGAGVSGPAVRFNTRGEVSLITLNKS
jgi:predicted MPP superfamily phosphohydrolase